jgi:hypothetical protein
MTIKIDTTAPLTESKSSVESTASRDVSSVAAPSTGTPVDAIVQELMDGHISSSEAVDRLIAHTLNSGMVKDAPESLRLEVEQMLRAAVETDPDLKSLAKNIE